MARISNDRYTRFLNKVLEMTKANGLSWKYLDHSKVLYEGMAWTPDYESFQGFNTEQSFYCTSDKTYIVLLVYNTAPANIYVVPNTFRNVVCLPAEEYGDIITRLLNVVRSQFPDGEAFIDKFLGE